MRLDMFNNTHFSRGCSLLKEFFWWVVRFLFFSHALPVPSIIKVFWLRLFGAKVGRGVVIRSKVFITFPWRVSIGDFVWIGDEVMILSLDKVTIGSHVCISQKVFLCTGAHDYQKETFDLVMWPIEIQDGVWICASSFICPGVVMGAGSMCSALSLVQDSVEERTIVGGNPAVYIKQRVEF